jgi:hypothetical protein
MLRNKAVKIVSNGENVLVMSDFEKTRLRNAMRLCATLCGKHLKVIDIGRCLPADDLRGRIEEIMAAQDASATIDELLSALSYD